MAQDHWLHGFDYNVEEWFEGYRYETLAICRQLAYARAAFKVAISLDWRLRPIHPPGIGGTLLRMTSFCAPEPNILDSLPASCGTWQHLASPQQRTTDFQWQRKVRVLQGQWQFCTCASLLLNCAPHGRRLNTECCIDGHRLGVGAPAKTLIIGKHRQARVKMIPRNYQQLGRLSANLNWEPALRSRCVP